MQIQIERRAVAGVLRAALLLAPLAIAWPQVEAQIPNAPKPNNQSASSSKPGGQKSSTQKAVGQKTGPQKSATSSPNALAPVSSIGRYKFMVGRNGILSFDTRTGVLSQVKESAGRASQGMIGKYDCLEDKQGNRWACDTTTGTCVPAKADM